MERTQNKAFIGEMDRKEHALSSKEVAVSVVVCVSGSREEVVHCAVSVLTQSFQDFELLLVECGAYGRVPALLEELERRCPERVRILRISSSRKEEGFNAALDVARGSYVMFLDPLDTIRLDALGSLHRMISANDADIAFCAHSNSYYYQGSRLSRTQGVLARRNPSKIAVDPAVIRDGYYFASGKLYSRRLLDANNIRFETEYPAFNDYIFLVRCQLLSQGTVVDDRVLYNRRENAKRMDRDEVATHGSLCMPSVLGHVMALRPEDSGAMREATNKNVKQMYRAFVYACLEDEAREYRSELLDMYVDYIKMHDPSWKSALCIMPTIRGLRGKVRRTAGSDLRVLRKTLLGNSDDIQSALCASSRVRSTLSNKLKSKKIAREKEESIRKKRSAILQQEGAEYLFTVIVPIYNVEPYLEDTLRSIVNQTVGFRESIQLVLVNDGSPDDSDVICRRYLEQFPENVVYVEQKNAGVGAACNAGLKRAQGVFVNFMGADDIWDWTTFAEALEFFYEHPEVPLVSFRMLYFEAASGNHILNFKYDHGSQLINVIDRYDFPQIEGGSAILRRDSIPLDTFGGDLLFSEDLKLVSDVILAGGCYGVLSGSSYYYRKRLAATAATDHGSRGYDWHFLSLTGCHEKLFARSKELFGRVVPYIQFVVMYDLQWRLGPDSFVAKLDEENRANYKSLLVGLFKSIDDEVILRQRNISLCEKVYALSLKHEIPFGEMQERLRIIDDTVYYLPPTRKAVSANPFHKLCSLDEVTKLYVQTMKIRNDAIRIIGTLNCLDKIEDVKLHACVRGEDIDVPLVRWDRTGTIDSFCEKNYFCFPSFDIEIPLADRQDISFSLDICGSSYNTSPCFCRFTMLTTPSSVHWAPPYVLSLGDGGKTLHIEKRAFSAEQHLALEKTHVDNLPAWVFSKQMMRLRRKVIKKQHAVRSSETWLIMDHLFEARDNGIALFLYLRKHPPKNVDVYFAISRRSSQYAGLKRLGNVVDRDSRKYQELYLLADKVICSRAEEFVYRPFGLRNNYMNDLEMSEFVFLQHGVALHDLAPILRQTGNRIDKMITSSEVERESILEGEYLFKESQVLLTGLPRYDALDPLSEPSKTIALMPTWRSELVLPFEDIGTERMARRRNPKFADSEFCKFLNGFFDDEVLIDLLRSHGYKMKLYLHPALVQQKKDFHKSDVVQIVDKFDYSTALNDAAMLITDYSSIACDFALLNRAIVYVQHDFNEYFDGNGRKLGRFDYEESGFGPVCHSRAQLVQTIGGFIESGCKMEEKYMRRVNDYRFVELGRCCARVVENIVDDEK